MIVRRGITRTVLLTKRYAVKLPSLRAHGDGLAGLLWSFCRGVLANQAERTWSSYDAWAGKLCPVLRSWLGGIVNVYPRCEPYEVTPEQEMAMFRRELRPVDIDPTPGDNKPENYGWLTIAGRRTLVFLDYDINYNGCPHDRSGVFNRLAEDTGVESLP